MTAVIQIGQKTITAAELPHLLARYRLLPQLVRELVIEEAIAQIECSEAEAEQGKAQFYAQNQLTTPEARQAWASAHKMSVQDLDNLALRTLKVEKFKQDTWGSKVETYFLERKSKLDQVVYSLIRTRDADVATELYFRICDGEDSFAELARDYSEGPEAQTGGIVGPVSLSTPHERIAQMLANSQPQQLWPPVRLGQWHVIVRLEKQIPATLDEGMRARLVEELFRQWLEAQCAQQSVSILPPDAKPSNASP